MNVLFVDDRLREILRLWEESGSGITHTLLPLETFDSIERTCQAVNLYQPDVVCIGYGLSSESATGGDVIRSLREMGFTGFIVANSGGSLDQFTRSGVVVDFSANRRPERLKNILDEIQNGV